MNQEYIKISELNNYIKSLLDKDHFLIRFILREKLVILKIILGDIFILL